MIVLRQKIFFQSKATGEYFTGKQLKDSAEAVKAEWRNGSVPIYDSKGKKLIGAAENLSNPKALRRAYIRKQLGYGVPVSQKSEEGAYKFLEKNNIISNVKRGSEGVESFVVTRPKSPVVRRLSKILNKGKKFIKR